MIVLPDARAVGLRAAAMVAELLREKPGAVLALPTGSTPRATYDELGRLHREEGLSFARAAAFNLDEYVGLPPDHPGACRRQIEEAFYRQVDLPPLQAYAPDGRAADLAEAAARYEAEIEAAGGLDLALLGIGVNGHIAFNEPPAAFDSRTHVEALRADTRAANQPFFGSTAVPSLAVTMGIGTILAARRCVLLATGAGKAAALGRAVEGPPSAAVPASALQLHPNATILADESAASLLSKRQRLRPPPAGA